MQYAHQSHLSLAVRLNQHALKKDDLAFFPTCLSGSDKRDVRTRSLRELSTWPAESLGHTLSTEALCHLLQLLLPGPVSCSFLLREGELPVHYLCDAFVFAFCAIFI